MSPYRRGREVTRVAAVVFAAAWVWGCPDTGLDEEKPTPPDMSALIADYQTPTADLTAETMPLLVESAFKTLDVILGTGGFGFVLEDVIGPALADDQSSGLTLAESGLRTHRQGLSVAGDGFAKVTRICNGWEGGVTPKASDGAIKLTIGFSGDNAGAQIDPVIWGAFVGCKYGLGSGEARRNLLVDGGVRMFLGNALSFSQVEQVEQSQLLMDIDGRVVLDGDIELEAMNFAINPGTGGIEFKLPVGNSHVLFGVKGDQNRFRAANGVWVCDFEAMTCDCTAECGSESSFSW